MNASDLFLKFPGFDVERKLQFGKPILFMGSCFSDEIAAKAKFSGLNAYSNPLGTIYHPLVIQRYLSDIVSKNGQFERIEYYNNRYFSFDGAYQFQFDQKRELVDELKLIQESWTELIKTASHLFITFGSAWGYRHLESNILVANCLKMPGNFFQKELVSINEIVESWLNVIPLIRTINPEIEICFTISPVRHIRDGLIENNRSKAILIESVQQIVQATNTNYIPTYEIMIDVLRDYRFFKEDLIHPSEASIQIIWDWLVNNMAEERIFNLINSVVKVRKAEAHRPLNNNTQAIALHREKIKIEKEKLYSLNPNINW